VHDRGTAHAWPLRGTAQLLAPGDARVPGRASTLCGSLACQATRASPAASSCAVVRSGHGAVDCAACIAQLQALLAGGERSSDFAAAC
jgi:hypothetical protein